MPRRTWLDGRVDVLLTALDRSGLILSRQAAATLVREQVARVAAQARVSEQSARRYLTDDALTQTAAQITDQLAGEQPGADLFILPRTVLIPTAVLGRALAGLSEAIQVHLLNEQPDTAATHVTNLAQLLSGLGQLVSDAGQRTPGDGSTRSGVPAPPAVLLRAARYLDTAANLADHGTLPGDLDPDQASSLVAALRRDATRLRTLATTDQHRHR